ncbi:hypothetical protein TNCV_704961 [Trichonephila clavipes]|nr:hypothetical protein TNCV_704961 [Trichonephila clavipes]
MTANDNYQPPRKADKAMPLVKYAGRSYCPTVERLPLSWLVIQLTKRSIKITRRDNTTWCLISDLHCLYDANTISIDIGKDKMNITSLTSNNTTERQKRGSAPCPHFGQPKDRIRPEEIGSNNFSRNSRPATLTDHKSF